MKKPITIFFLMCLYCTALFSQNNFKKSDDIGRLSICPYVNLDLSKFSPDAQDFLREKLSQIVVSRSIGGQNGNTRFVLAASVQYSSKYTLPGSPVRYAYEIIVSFYLGDGVEGKLFASTNLTVNGIGTSQTKALKDAIKKIDVNSNVFDDLIVKGKTKIIEYYNANCDAQIINAESLASQGNTSQALLKLSEIPDVARDCYLKSNVLAVKLYKKLKENECSMLLNKAQNTWAANPNTNGGEQVASILNSIDPETTCFNSAKSLIEKINNEIKGTNLKIEKLNSKYKLLEQKNQFELEKERINSIKEMVTSYYNSQPSTIIYYEQYNISPWYY